MVNKAAIGILGVIVVASLGVGTLVGMQLAGGGSADVADDGEGTTDADETTATSTATATPANETNATQGNATVTETVRTSTPTPTPIPARKFSESQVRKYVIQYVNAERQALGRERLSVGGTTGGKLQSMAKNHSVEMSTADEPVHEVDGVDTRDRYRNFALFDRCKFEAVGASYVREPDESFESVALTYAGKSYQANGSTQFNDDERAVARAIVDQWMSSDTYRDRILRRGPTRLGVGVQVTVDGKVFATADVCA